MVRGLRPNVFQKQINLKSVILVNYIMLGTIIRLFLGPFTYRYLDWILTFTQPHEFFSWFLLTLVLYCTWTQFSVVLRQHLRTTLCICLQTNEGSTVKEEEEKEFVPFYHDETFNFWQQPHEHYLHKICIVV